MVRAIALLVIGLLAALPAVAADKVVFTTDFGFNGRHAYYYVADEKGYYKDAGIEVQFVRGGGSVDSIKKVAAGNADLGFADASSLVLARGNDDVPVKLVAIVYASPPHAVYALEGSGIRTPKDLEGRSIADSAGSSNTAMFGAYAKAARIDQAKVSWVVTDSAALPTLLATGRVEVIGQFIVGEPLLAKTVAPKKLVRLAYRDVGLDYYGNGIIAQESTIATKRDLVQRFVTATIKGMETAFADPAEAGRILAKYHRNIDPAIGQGETERVRELATVPGMPLGKIDPKRIASTVEVVSNAYKLRHPVDPKDLWVPGFVR
jgi:NitT/TauT family transport system substrate-binding protein